MLLGRKVFVASSLLAGAGLLARVLDMIAALVIARFLTPADFGMVTLALASLMILRALTELPVTEALIRTPELKSEDVHTGFTLATLRGLLVTLLLCAAAWPMALIYDDQRLFGLMLGVSAVPLIQSLRSPLLVRFSRAVNYGPATIIDVSSRIVGFVVAVGFAIVTQSYWALVIQLIVPPLLATPASYFVAPYRPRISFASWRMILSFAGWITLARFVNTANGETDRFFIGGILGKASLGYFAMGRGLATTASWAIGTPLVQAMFPGFAKLQGDEPGMRKAYLKGQAMLVAALMPVGIGLALLAEPLIAIVLGEQWMAVAPVVQVFAPVGALTTMVMPTHAVVMALNRTPQLLIRETIMFAVSLPAVIGGAYWFGLMGAVWARFAAGVVGILLSLEMIQRLLGVSIAAQLLNSWRSVASTAIMAGVVLLVRARVDAALSLGGGLLENSLLIAIPALAGGVTYVAAHALLWQLARRPDGPEAFLTGVVIDGWAKVMAARRGKASAG